MVVVFFIYLFFFYNWRSKRFDRFETMIQISLVLIKAQYKAEESGSGSSLSEHMN